MKPNGGELFAYLEITILAELRSNAPVATNNRKKIIKIVVFSQIGGLIPLYDEKSTIVESKTNTMVKTNAKTNEFFFVRLRAE